MKEIMEYFKASYTQKNCDGNNTPLIADTAAFFLLHVYLFHYVQMAISYSRWGLNFQTELLLKFPNHFSGFEGLSRQFKGTLQNL